MKKEYRKPQTTVFHITNHRILANSDEPGGYNGVSGGGTTNQFKAKQSDLIWDQTED